MLTHTLVTRAMHLIMFWFSETGGNKGEKGKKSGGRRWGGPPTSSCDSWTLHVPLGICLWREPAPTSWPQSWVSSTVSSDVRSYNEELMARYVLHLCVCLCIWLCIKFSSGFPGSPLKPVAASDGMRGRGGLMSWQRWPVSTSYPFPFLLLSCVHGCPE